MRRALFLHGTGGSPDDHWWPWLREQFEQGGYEVWAPVLPDNMRPNANKYWEFLHNSDWDFTDNVLVGHSSGATSVLNLLSNPEFPKAKAAVLVGAFLNERLTKGSSDFTDNTQFKDLFPAEGFDWQYVKSRSDKFYFIHGDNDPYCAHEDTKEAANLVGGKLVTVYGGGHLSGGVHELPEMAEVLKDEGIL